MDADKKTSLFFNEENLKLLVELCNLHYRFLNAESFNDEFSSEDHERYYELQATLFLNTHEAVEMLQRLTRITALLKIPVCNVDYNIDD